MNKGPYVIRCVTWYGGQCPFEGQFLKRYDPDYRGGLGRAWWTDNLEKALTFADFVAARDCWARTSKVRPVREDGKPNRPLTAFTVTFVSLAEANKPEDPLLRTISDEMMQAKVERDQEH